MKRWIALILVSLLVLAGGLAWARQSRIRTDTCRLALDAAFAGEAFLRKSVVSGRIDFYTGAAATYEEALNDVYERSAGASRRYELIVDNFLGFFGGRGTMEMFREISSIRESFLTTEEFALGTSAEDPDTPGYEDIKAAREREAWDLVESSVLRLETFVRKCG